MTDRTNCPKCLESSATHGETCREPDPRTAQIADLTAALEASKIIIDLEHECPGCDENHRDGHYDSCACDVCKLVAAFDAAMQKLGG